MLNWSNDHGDDDEIFKNNDGKNQIDENRLIQK